MKTLNNYKKWSTRTNNAVAALLFLASYSISMVAPFMPAAHAQTVDATDQTQTQTQSVSTDTTVTDSEAPTPAPQASLPVSDSTPPQADTATKDSPIAPAIMDLSLMMPSGNGGYNPHPQKGTITIVKDAQPNSNLSFSFSTSGLDANQPKNFLLKDSGTYPYTNQQSFSGLNAEGTYSFSETGLSDNGWTLDSIVCTGGHKSIITTVLPTASIKLAAGEDITCTFTNKVYGQLIVRKTTYPSGDTQMFDVSAKSSNSGMIYGSSTNTVSDSKDATFKIQQGKTYSVTETVPNGWMQTANNCENKSVTDWSTKVGGIPTEYCDIVNTKLAILTIVKQTNPDGSQTPFNFSTSGQLNNTFQLADGQSKTYSTLVPGSEVKVSEAQSQNGDWKLTNLVCDNKGVTINLWSGYVSFKPKAGESATCTFTNTEQTGTITVIKNVDDGFGHITKDVKTWTWKYESRDQHGYGISTGSNNAQTVPVGTYTVSEDQKPGYHVVASSCSDNNYHDSYSSDGGWGQGGKNDNLSISQSVSVGLGKNVTCTFTNKHDTGTITVHKKIGDMVDPKGWTWWLQNNGSHIDMGDTVKVATGNYQFGENQKVDYSFVSLKCTEDGRTVGVSQNVTANINIGKDDHIVCTFTNTRGTGNVTIIKDAQPDSSQGFVFTIEPVSTDTHHGDSSDSERSWSEAVVGKPDTMQSDWYNHGNNSGNSNPTKTFTLRDDGDSSGNSYSTSLPTGKYRVSEAAVTGWDLKSISCNGKEAKTNNGFLYLDVVNGANIVCTFTNTTTVTSPMGAQLTIVKDVQPGTSSKAFSFTTNAATGANSSFNLTDDGTGLTNSKQFTDLIPGTYTVTEQADSAWKLNDIVCTGTGVTMTHDGAKLTVTLVAGAVASCTFVNSFIPQVLGDTTVAPEPVPVAPNPAPTLPTLVNTGTPGLLATTIVALSLITTAVWVTLRRRSLADEVWNA